MCRSQVSRTDDVVRVVTDSILATSTEHGVTLEAVPDDSGEPSHSVHLSPAEWDDLVKIFRTRVLGRDIAPIKPIFGVNSVSVASGDEEIELDRETVLAISQEIDS